MDCAFLAPVTPFTHKKQLASSKRCPIRNNAVCRVAEAKPSVAVFTPSPVVESVADLLRQDLEVFFDPSNPIDYSMYSPDFSFEDPLTKMRGVKKYEKHITFLERSILFSNAQFNLLDLRIIGDRLDTIRTRWYLSLTINLPWRPCATFTGQSDYIVDIPSRKIRKQVDYWDSLDDSSFFSFSAVKDFVTQLVPSQPSVVKFRGFDILRRTRFYEIRNFDNHVSERTIIEVRNSSSPVATWRLSKGSSRTDGIELRNVAVMKLSGAPKNARELAESERRLRNLLSDVSFAKAGKTCVYVQETINARPVHELWLELSEANAEVDF